MEKIRYRQDYFKKIMRGMVRQGCVFPVFFKKQP